MNGSPPLRRVLFDLQHALKKNAFEIYERGVARITVGSDSCGRIGRPPPIAFYWRERSADLMSW